MFSISDEAGNKVFELSNDTVVLLKDMQQLLSKHQISLDATIQDICRICIDIFLWAESKGVLLIVQKNFRDNLIRSSKLGLSVIKVITELSEEDDNVNSD